MSEQNPFPDFSKTSGEMYRNWEKAMTDWWDQVLESPAFLQAMGENVANSTSMRSTWEENVDKAMEQMHLPARKDLVRLTRIATLLEDKLLSLEDRLLAMEDRLLSMERDGLKARLDTAETLLLLKEKLDTIEQKLDPQPAPAAPRGRRPNSKA